MPNALPKLVVLGGSGFVGREVCREAVQRGLEVVSLSRRGPPRSEVVHGVRWIDCDLGAAGMWRAELTSAAAVVHSVGITREDRPAGQTFARIHADSAILAAEAAVQVGVQTFVYMSAAEKPPLVHEEYLTTKRRAEHALLKLPLRVVVLRPGLVYGQGRPRTLLAGAVAKVARLVGARAAGLEKLPLIDVHTLARAALRVALQGDTRGVVGPEKLPELGA